MCEANAYVLKKGQEELILESVDIIEPMEESSYRLVNIFGEQKIIKGAISQINLINHKILFEESS